MGKLFCQGCKKVQPAILHFRRSDFGMLVYRVRCLVCLKDGNPFSLR